MTETNSRCPDCGVRMEEMDLQVGGRSSLAFLSGESREGLLGKLGLNQRYHGSARSADWHAFTPTWGSDREGRGRKS